jgi:hypothetical protein
MTTETTSVDTNKEWEPQKLHGMRLLLIFASMTLVTFLALLDTSILGTVWSHFHSQYSTPSTC